VGVENIHTQLHFFQPVSVPAYVTTTVRFTFAKSIHMKRRPDMPNLAILCMHIIGSNPFHENFSLSFPL